MVTIYVLMYFDLVRILYMYVIDPAETVVLPMHNLLWGLLISLHVLVCIFYLLLIDLSHAPRGLPKMIRH